MVGRVLGLVCGTPRWPRSQWTTPTSPPKKRGNMMGPTPASRWTASAGGRTFEGSARGQAPAGARTDCRHIGRHAMQMQNVSATRQGTNDGTLEISYRFMSRLAERKAEPARGASGTDHRQPRRRRGRSYRFDGVAHRPARGTRGRVKQHDVEGQRGGSRKAAERRAILPRPGPERRRRTPGC